MWYDNYEKNTIKVRKLYLYIFSDEHDPFNRSPLKIDELKEDAALKARIEKWI